MAKRKPQWLDTPLTPPECAEQDWWRKAKRVYFNEEESSWEKNDALESWNRPESYLGKGPPTGATVESENRCGFWVTRWD